MTAADPRPVVYSNGGPHQWLVFNENELLDAKTVKAEGGPRRYYALIDWHGWLGIANTEYNDAQRRLKERKR